MRCLAQCRVSGFWCCCCCSFMKEAVVVVLMMPKMRLSRDDGNSWFRG